MMILYFDKGLQQLKNHKKEKSKFVSLAHIVVRNWTRFYNQIYLNRLPYEKTLNCSKRKIGNCKNISTDFNKELKQFKKLKKENQKFLVEIVDINWTCFNNQISLKRP